MEPEKLYRKITCIEVVEVLSNGDVRVQNHGDSSDIWVIPKDTFASTYVPVTEIYAGSFGWAIDMLKLGHKVARAGWNGKGMWLILQSGSEVELRDGSCYHKAGLRHVTIDPHIDMFTAGGTMQPGWLASQADMLSLDWCVVK